MYLHLGNDTVIKTADIVGIFDLDNVTLMKAGREYLTMAEKSGEAVTVSTELPKSFVVCVDKDNQRKIYISQLSSQTLIKRTAFLKKIQ